MADFPNDVYELRDLENIPGQEFDADKKTVVYAEDIAGLGAEITAMEEELETGLLGEWVDYTPVISQGASTNISKTIVRARYKKNGKTIMAQAVCVASATGTANNNIGMTLPSTAKTGSIFIGFFGYYDASANISYIGGATLGLGLNIVSGARDNTGGGSYIGTAPNIAVGSGDYIIYNVTYEE